MLSVKEDGIKYHFFSLWYDSTWDWTSFSRTIGEHCTHLTNSLLKEGVITAFFLFITQYFIKIRIKVKKNFFYDL